MLTLKSRDALDRLRFSVCDLECSLFFRRLASFGWRIWPLVSPAAMAYQHSRRRRPRSDLPSSWLSCRRYNITRAAADPRGN